METQSCLRAALVEAQGVEWCEHLGTASGSAWLEGREPGRELAGGMPGLLC